ncbi:glycosyltransferase family 4 protein [Methanotorris formicicus]|uniref:Glycosyl transferase group 1 n=1 Tax=Methanotorris formicicus Mc-S-70 TaxID=647171 RepID=H1KWH0_9EURY|nr:glycosyltransferase family 4 protein [Methanotorris formicicus]EHP89547.1 glycosyl transferase group 1 [Methanotorris formicicus Mc-S-70]
MDKILYVHNADFSKPCANRIQVLNMCKAFKKIGQNITLLSFNCDKEILKNLYGEDVDFNLISLKPIGNYYIRSLLLFLKFLRLKSDYNWIYTRDLIFAFLVSKFFKSKKVIYELHDASKDKIWHFLFKRTFKNLYCCVVISEGLKNDLTKLGFNSDRIKVLHDGVDLEKFDINISKEEARDVLELPRGKIIVTYTGSLQNWKGYKTFLKSYDHLENKENIAYLVVGGNEEQVSKLREEYKNKNIIFIPFVENSKIPLFLKASDILVIPNSSKYEISIKYTSPLKLFEYMASKRPIIASDLPSIREVVSENEVLFFKADNEEDLALKIEKLINDKDLQNKLVYNAYKKIKVYTWEERCKKISNYFNDWMKY